MQFYDADYAMVVTNSRYTAAARSSGNHGVELASGRPISEKFIGSHLA